MDGAGRPTGMRASGAEAQVIHLIHETGKKRARFARQQRDHRSRRLIEEKSAGVDSIAERSRSTPTRISPIRHASSTASSTESA